MKKRILYWFMGFTLFFGWADLVWGQQTYTEAEVLNIIEERDAQWKSKVEKCEVLSDARLYMYEEAEEIIENFDEQAKVDSLLLIAKDKQIELLKARDEMNEKIVKLVKPKWHDPLKWIGLGLLIGLIE